MSYNNEYSSTDRRGDNTYGSSGFDTTRDNTTGTGNFDRGFEGRDREGRERVGDDFGASGGEFGRAGHVGGTDAQRDYRGSEGGLGGQDRSTEFGHGGVRTQDRFDNTGAIGTGAYGDRTDDNYGSRDRSDNLGSTGTGAFDRTDDTHGSRGRTDNFGLTGSGAGRDDFDRGDDTYGSSGTGRGYDNTTGTQHKPTMGEKVKGTMESATGKITRNPEKVEHGRELKSGEADNNVNRNY